MSLHVGALPLPRQPRGSKVIEHGLARLEGGGAGGEESASLDHFCEGSARGAAVATRGAADGARGARERARRARVAMGRVCALVWRRELRIAVSLIEREQNVTPRTLAAGAQRGPGGAGMRVVSARELSLMLGLRLASRPARILCFLPPGRRTRPRSAAFGAGTNGGVAALPGPSQQVSKQDRGKIAILLNRQATQGYSLASVD